ncbi:queuosine precursor transporter [Halioxenophilus sp. WMMB6]|uniref:queuosine precursor transporter n=1 Tax=Halioxenophilus sp. WMMB6 TaxID=3073815 RepID=UPI00295EBCB3|nr:queuosine precursor transporter [Halioxenophilus sp. WMMB6]
MSETEHPSLPAIEFKFLILLSVFISCMSFINVVSAKLWSFAGLTISGGIMAYWLTFPITDVVGEIFGRKRAFFVVWMGLLANVIVLSLSQIAIQLPPAAIYQDQESLAKVLGAVPVIVLASLLAYLVAQMHDVWAFDFWRRRTGGKHLWLRNNLSTIVSQLLDSLVFNGIAFYLFAAERMPLSAFVAMTLGYWLFKLVIALIDTPVVYLLVAWLQPKKAQAAG